MKITAVSVDEQKNEYVVRLESGEEFTGFKAMNRIQFRRNPLNAEQLEVCLNTAARKHLRELKKTAGKPRIK